MVATESKSLKRDRMPRTKQSLPNLNPDECIGLNGHCQI